MATRTIALSVIAVLALAIPAGRAWSADDNLNEGKIGFSMVPPAWAVGNNGMICSFFLPPADNFAANVGVMIQPYKGTLQEYDTLSLAQLKQSQATILIDKIEDDCLTYEYTAVMQNKAMHFYTRAFKHGSSKVYLATATCLDASAPAQLPILQASVDSFVVAQKGAAAHAAATHAATVP
jgi:hypothetical protein